MISHHPDHNQDSERDRNRQPVHILDQDEQRRLTLQAMTGSQLNLHRVWTYYFGLCGTTDEYEVDAYLHGLIHLPACDRDLIAVAINELIDEVPPPVHAPYSCDSYPPAP